MFDKVNIGRIDSAEIKPNYYTVLSVELGNTTIKSIIVSTNIKNNQFYYLSKVIHLTRDIRSPKESEEVFGYTIWDKKLSKEAIQEAISEVILESLSKAKLRIGDLDFVVRSTGIVALDTISKEMGLIIKALSDACLNVGIKPSQMTPPFSLNNIPDHIRKFSFFNSIEFDGSVVSVSSPKYSGITSNEMESQLVTAGIKLASKQSIVEFRNPCISIDMGTTLAGQVIDDSKPYSNILCNYVGLAGGIMDIILRGCNVINEKYSTIDLSYNQNNINLNYDKIHKTSKKLHDCIDIMEVPENIDSFGGVHVCNNLSKSNNIKIIGSRINDETKLIRIFSKNVNLDNISEINYQIDDFYAYFIKRLIIQTKSIIPFINNDKITLGITGRAGITNDKPQIVSSYLKDYFNEIIFVEDGLALGALMMARCMNSLGSPTYPIGGLKNDFCIMQQRMRIQKKINKKS